MFVFLFKMFQILQNPELSVQLTSFVFYVFAPSGDG